MKSNAIKYPPALSDSSRSYASKLDAVLNASNGGSYKTPGDKQDAIYRLCQLNKVLYSDLIIYADRIEKRKLNELF